METLWTSWYKQKEVKRVYGKRVHGERVYEQGLYVEGVHGKRVYGNEVYAKRVYKREAYDKKLYDRTKERGCDTKGNCREVYDRKVKVKKAGADKKGADIKENCREVGGYRKCDGRKAFLLYLRHNLIHLL